MRFLSVLIFLFAVNSILYSQTKKYKFNLPQRDSVAFLPYQFSGTYKNSVLSYSIQFEKDFLSPQNGQSIPSMSTSVEPTYKPNGLRHVKFRFEFFDSTSKLLLDASTAFNIDLVDRYAIPPITDIIRFKYNIPVEPFKVKFSWSFYEDDPNNKTQKAFMWSSSHVIQLYKYSEDYSNAKFIMDGNWSSKW